MQKGSLCPVHIQIGKQKYLEYIAHPRKPDPSTQLSLLFFSLPELCSTNSILIPLGKFTSFSLNWGAQKKNFSWSTACPLLPYPSKKIAFWPFVLDGGRAVWAQLTLCEWPCGRMGEWKGCLPGRWEPGLLVLTLFCWGCQSPSLGWAVSVLSFTRLEHSKALQFFYLGVLCALAFAWMSVSNLP